MMLRSTLVSAAVVVGLIASAGAAAARPAASVPDPSAAERSEEVAEGAAEMLGGAFHAIPGWSRDSLRELRKTLFQ